MKVHSRVQVYPFVSSRPFLKLRRGKILRTTNQDTKNNQVLRNSNSAALSAKMDTCSLPLKIHFWIVSPELMSLKHPMSHDNRIPGWKAVCGKVVGRCTAALALLPCSCAAEEKSQQVKALHGWQGELEATAGAHSGRTSYLLRLIVAPADTASTLVFSSSSLVKSVEVSYPHGGITRNDFVHLIHFSPLEEA